MFYDHCKVHGGSRYVAAETSDSSLYVKYSEA